MVKKSTRDASWPCLQRRKASSRWQMISKSKDQRISLLKPVLSLSLPHHSQQPCTQHASSPAGYLESSRGCAYSASDRPPALRVWLQLVDSLYPKGGQPGSLVGDQAGRMVSFQGGCHILAAMAASLSLRCTRFDWASRPSARRPTPTLWDRQHLDFGCRLLILHHPGDLAQHSV